MEAPDTDDPVALDALDDAVVVRATADERQADDWSLVLASAGIAHRLDRTGDGFHLLVAPAEAPTAESAIADYQREAEAPPPPPPPPLVEYGPTMTGALVALALGAFFLVTGPRDPASPWFALGSADAARIVAGEWWRTVTALTLHANIGHVFGNAVASIVFVAAVARWIGPGPGLSLVLLGGALGNALTAWIHGARHISVGASTATFAALGLLGALQLLHRRHGPGGGRRAFIVAAASVALLGFLGTGENSDMLAHLFGFLSGALLGLVAAFALRRPPRAPVQVALALASIALVAGAWWASGVGAALRAR